VAASIFLLFVAFIAVVAIADRIAPSPASTTTKAAQSTRSAKTERAKVHERERAPIEDLGKIVVPAAAKEKPVHLKQAPGLDKVEANCVACHSLDYIEMNSPFLNSAQWDAEVAKMIHAMGAPIDAADAKVIADYLTKNYGR